MRLRWCNSFIRKIIEKLSSYLPNNRPKEEVFEMPLPLASVDKLIRKAGAHRVSEGAAEILARHLEEIAIEITRKHNNG